MTRTFGLDNPIAYAHFHLKGGWRSTIWFASAYLACAVLLLMLFIQLDERWQQSIRVVPTLILVVQAISMCLFGPSRIAAAIRADVTTGMIELHRLMPVSAVRGVIGYLVGSLLQPLIVFGLNVVIGLGVVMVSGHDPQEWLFINAILLLAGVCIGCVSAAGAYTGVAGPGWVMVVAVGLGINFGFAVTYIPALVPLLAPSLVEQIFRLRLDPDSMGMHLISVGAWMMLGTIGFLSACRRYARSDVSRMGVLLGLALLVVYALLSLIGPDWILEKQTFGGFMAGNYQPEMAWHGSMIAGMLLALVPIANAARERSAGVSGRRQPHSVPVAAPWISLVCSLILLTLWLGFAAEKWHHYMDYVIPVGLSISAALVSMALFLARWYLFSELGIISGFIWIVVAWMGPILADGIIGLLTTPVAGWNTNYFSCLSPIGTLIQLDNAPDRNIWFGVLAQCLVVPVLAIRLLRAQKAARHMQEILQGS